MIDVVPSETEAAKREENKLRLQLKPKELDQKWKIEIENNEYCYTEIDEELDNVTFTHKQSSASCPISEI